MWQCFTWLALLRSAAACLGFCYPNIVMRECQGSLHRHVGAYKNYGAPTHTRLVHNTRCCLMVEAACCDCEKVLPHPLPLRAWFRQPCHLTMLYRSCTSVSTRHFLFRALLRPMSVGEMKSSIAHRCCTFRTCWRLWCFTTQAKARQLRSATKLVLFLSSIYRLLPSCT
jgi:hypothetical protein